MRLEHECPVCASMAQLYDVVDFNRSSIKSIDDVRVKRLGELDTSIELGGYVGIGKTGVFTSPYDRLSFSVGLQ